MQNNVSIQTISQVHIGSGVMLRKDSDFIVVNKDGASDIYVIDTDKLGKIIGTDSATIDKWVASIERGHADDFIKSRIAGHAPEEFASRHITNFADFSKTQGTLKECLHDAMERPYIPGSTIKGAIRTAILATLAERQNESMLQRKYMSFEKEMFGRNPNVDIGRFLIVGDAFFDKSSEIAVRQINLNVTRRESLIDEKKHQIVEAIGIDELSSFSMKIDKEKYDNVLAANHKEMKGLPGLPANDLISLFSLINQHSQRLVESEINIWREDFSQYTGQQGYIEVMEDMLETIKSCGTGECVLRLGQAIGWRFITGAWTELLDEDFFYDNIVKVARYRNQVYSQFVFPKSRRIDDESCVFGFVKLKLVS